MKSMLFVVGMTIVILKFLRLCYHCKNEGHENKSTTKEL